VAVAALQNKWHKAAMATASGGSIIGKGAMTAITN